MTLRKTKHVWLRDMSVRDVIIINADTQKCTCILVNSLFLVGATVSIDSEAIQHQYDR